MADLVPRDFDFHCLGGKNGACGEPNEIKSERHLAGFVEIINSPHEPVSGIAPDAKVFDMEISYRDEDVFMPIVKVTALLAPSLKPPIKRPAKKCEGIRSHPGMLHFQPPVLQIGLIRQPRLVE